MRSNAWYVRIGLILAGVCVVFGMRQENSGLSAELNQRARRDGLGLVRTAPGKIWEVAFLNGQSGVIDNPRGLSGAWFSGNGKTVAWNIVSPGREFKACPSPIVVAAFDGTKIWQVPGNVINSAAVAVSDDGLRV